MRGFWPVELAELADGPTGCGAVARGGCVFCCFFFFFWDLSVTRSAVLKEAEGSHSTNHDAVAALVTRS